MILVLLAQACTLTAEDPSADKPAAVKKPRSYTRTLNFHSAKTPEIEHPMEKAAGRPEKDFLKLDRFRPPTAFSPPTMPIPVLPPPGQSPEPGRKKNWILPPMAED